MINYFKLSLNFIIGLNGLSSAWRRTKTVVDVLGCLLQIAPNCLFGPGGKLGVLRWLDQSPYSWVWPEILIISTCYASWMYSTSTSATCVTGWPPSYVPNDQDLKVVFYVRTTLGVTGQIDLRVGAPSPLWWLANSCCPTCKPQRAFLSPMKYILAIWQRQKHFSR